MDHYWWLLRRSQLRRFDVAAISGTRTFSDLDLGAGITLGHIFDASHYLRHGGRSVWVAVERVVLEVVGDSGFRRECVLGARESTAARSRRRRIEDGRGMPRLIPRFVATQNAPTSLLRTVCGSSWREDVGGQEREGEGDRQQAQVTRCSIPRRRRDYRDGVGRAERVGIPRRGQIRRGLLCGGSCRLEV